jgi:DNA-binding NtrC family response regulator
MPDMDGMELLEAAKSLDKRVVVLVITGYGTIESAVTAIKKGAFYKGLRVLSPGRQVLAGGSHL